MKLKKVINNKSKTIQRNLYSPCAVIVHGECEKLIVNYIKAYYKIPIIIFSESIGKKSIELTSLKTFIKRSDLKCISIFIKNYGDKLDVYKRKEIFNKLDKKKTNIMIFINYLEEVCKKL